jgi:uncharacterized C2H2 Zn-finger protein
MLAGRGRPDGNRRDASRVGRPHLAVLPATVVPVAVDATDGDESGEVDWFGSPVRPPDARRPVPCPRCGAPFTEQDALATHAAEVHGIRVRRHPLGTGQRARMNRWWDSLGFLPLWLVVPANALVAAAAVTWLWPENPRWAIYAGGLSTLPLVLVLTHRQGR